jgi:hypothetical protein
VLKDGEKKRSEFPDDHVNFAVLETCSDKEYVYKYKIHPECHMIIATDVEYYELPLESANQSCRLGIFSLKGGKN